MILDRDLFESDDDLQEEVATRQKTRSACDFNCLSRFYNELMDDGAVERTSLGCFAFKDRLEFMFALACRNVLSDMDPDRMERDGDDQRGEGVVPSASGNTSNAQH